MNFVDIFKKSFLEGYAAANISAETIFICMVTTALIGTYIFIMYRIINRNAFYNKNFNIALLALAIITASVILTIQSSIVVSLGMVGALSIVRFRTAIKDPMDLVFLFWSISIGIMCGANCTVIAVIASIVVTAGILLADFLPIAKAPQILLINSSTYENENDLLEVVKKHCSLHRVKARNLTKDHLDLAIEVRTKNENELVVELMGMENVTSASLVSHDGEVTF